MNFYWLIASLVAYTRVTGFKLSTSTLLSFHPKLSNHRHFYLSNPIPTIYFVRTERFVVSTESFTEDSVVTSQPNDNIDTNNSTNTFIDDSKSLSLDYLRLEREKKRIDYIAADLAVKKLETQLKQNGTSTLMKGTYDYGFISKSNGPMVSTKSAAGDNVPASAFTLGISTFKDNLNDIFRFFQKKRERFDDPVRQKLLSLKLSNDEIWKREASRPEVKAPWIIKAPYLFLCVLLDNLFDGKPINRFYFLETVARMPYFSYITMLHAYETLGWWRRSTETKRVHFAEEYNEYHHLLIMEALGGDQDWTVRFFAQHASIVYFFVLIGLWLTSPSLAYNFSELIEAHAVDTYTEFTVSNKDILLQMEAPLIAKEYYENVDMYVFDEFQTNRVKGTRRPTIESLYDVFSNICQDEAAHVATMSACQDPEVLVRSPNTEAAIIASTLSLVLVATLSSNLVLPNLGAEVETVLKEIFNSAGTVSNTATEISTATQIATTTAAEAAAAAAAASASSSSSAVSTDTTTSIDAMIGAKNALSTSGGAQDIKAIIQTIADLISKLRF